MAERILIVDDEHKLAALLGYYLAQEGFEVALLHRGERGRPAGAASLTRTPAQ